VREKEGETSSDRRCSTDLWIFFLGHSQKKALKTREREKKGGARSLPWPLPAPAPLRQMAATLASAPAQGQETARPGAPSAALGSDDAPLSSGIGGVDHRRQRKPDAFDDERFDAVAFVNEMFPTGALSVDGKQVGASGLFTWRESSSSRGLEESARERGRRFENPFDAITFLSLLSTLTLTSKKKKT